MSNAFDWLVENETAFRKQRLPSLYSDLAQQKAANPDGFSANVAAWTTGLTRAALAGQLPLEQKIILECSDELLNVLGSSQYGRPSGLGVVLDEAIRQGKMLSLRDFLNAEHSIYQRSWIPTLGTILTWTLRQAGLSRSSFDKDGRLKSGRLVMLENLETIYRKLEASRAQKSDAITDRVLTRDAFTHVLKDSIGMSLSKTEQDILLKYLQRDKGILTYNDHTIKFKTTSAATPEPLTQEDATVASLSALISSLNIQISSLNTKIEELQSQAKLAVEHKSTTKAISALRSKRLAEQTLKSRSDTLYKLEEVYTAIQQAADQVAMVKVMQRSAETLRSLNKQVGGADKVDAIMDDLREQIDETTDVQKILQEPLSGDAVIDENEIDAEFEALRKEEIENTRSEQERRAEEKEREKDALLAAQRIEDRKTEMARRKEAAEANTQGGIDNSTNKLKELKLDDEIHEQQQIHQTEQERPAEAVITGS